MSPLYALLAAALAAAAPGRDHPRGTGAVAYVTAQRTYLDVGSDDGLAAGAVLELRRGGDAVGRCTVDVLTPSHASCPGGRARPGDTFTFAAGPEIRPQVKTLPPPPTEAVLQNRWAVLSTAPVPLVEARVSAAGDQPAPRSRVIDVSLEHVTWSSSGVGADHREAVDVVLRGAPITRWLTLDVDARAEHWSHSEPARFRPQDDNQLYVWQAQLTATPRPDLTFAAGRVQPWDIPGASIFDGGLAGWRGHLGQNRLGLGLFGGTVPQPDTLDVTSQRATAGGYWSLDRAFTGGGSFRHEGRLAMVRSPELGTRGEASLAGRLFLRGFDTSADLQLGGGGDVHADGYVDAARVDATLRPVGGLSLGGSFRYAGLPYPQTFDPVAFPGRGHHADAFAAWDVGPRLRLAATGGESKDLDSGLDRQWVGPELTLPRLLFGWGNLSLGYLYERGWLGGQSAYAQVVARPWTPLRFLVRTSWARTSNLTIDNDELALYLSAQADLSSHFALRLAGSGRTGMSFSAGESEAGTTAWGWTGYANLVASY
ncbi:MAG: hypothetical protein QM767_00595 [Anaeromyxobacter sp.]